MRKEALRENNQVNDVFSFWRNSGILTFSQHAMTKYLT